MIELPITGRRIYPVHNRNDLATSIRWDITSVDLKNRIAHIDFTFQLMYKKSFVDSGYDFYFGMADDPTNVSNWYLNVEQTAPVATAQRIDMKAAVGDAFNSTYFDPVRWNDHYYDNFHGYEIEEGYEDWECKSFSESTSFFDVYGFGATGWTAGGDYAYSEEGTIDFTFTWEDAELSLIFGNTTNKYGFFGRYTHTDSFTISFGVPTNINVPNGYLGDVLRVKLSNSTTDVSSLKHTVEYTVGNTTGYIIQNTSLKAFDWTVPMELLNEFPDGKQYLPCFITCYTYTGDGELIGSDTIKRYVFLDADTNGIFLNFHTYAADDLTKGLTPHDDILIRFISQATVEIEVLAHEDISKIVVSNNGVDYIALTSDMCSEEQFPGGLPNVYKASFTVPNIENKYFTGVAYGESGTTHTYSYEAILIEYDKLTINPHSFVFNPNGIITCNINGIVFTETFGGYSANRMFLYYRSALSREELATTEWIKYSEPNWNNGLYNVDFQLTGYDIQKKYYFEFKVVDKCMETASRVIVVIGKPVFDWSGETFHFGVPIESDREMIFDADSGIGSVDTNGNEKITVVPCDSIGNTVIGYPNYQQESGNTMIYGNEVNVFANAGFSINGIEYGKSEVLWQGSEVMGENDSIYLSEAVSNQPNGIMLIFSTQNSSGYPQNSSFNSFFVSKKQVELLSGYGHTFLLGINAGFSGMAAKYLYFYNTYITGHSGNISSGTNSGITFNNNNYVLRMVIGV